jgi:hypothetical protein
MSHAPRARTAPRLCGLSAPSAKPHSAFGPRSGSMSRGTSACVGPGRVGPGRVARAVSGGAALSHAAFGRVVSPARPLRPAVPRRARWWHAEPRDQLVSLQAWGPRRRSEESGVGIELRDRPKSCRGCPVACSTGAGESLPLLDADDDQPCFRSTVSGSPAVSGAAVTRRRCLSSEGGRTCPAVVEARCSGRC